ncbi:MAG: hypothetical protein ACREJ8_10640, partial [Candidatus Methylomirabilales bacterium]
MSCSSDSMTDYRSPTTEGIGTVFAVVGRLSSVIGFFRSSDNGRRSSRMGRRMAAVLLVLLLLSPRAAAAPDP